MLTPEHEIEPVLRWLQENGYRVAFRDQGWVECLLWCDGERWLGRGADRDEAADDALRQAFPSRAARLLLAGLGAPAVVSAPEQAPPEAVPPDELTDDAPPPEETEPAAPPEAPPPEAKPPEDLVAPVPAPQPAPQPRRRIVEAMTTEEALDSLGLLEDAITAERPEVALMVPERQGLILLAWICRARSAEESTEEEPEVVARVADLARTLSGWSKAWWPGTVVGLRRDASPGDVGRALGIAVDDRPRTWAEAATAAEAKIEAWEERDERAGLDEYGWADAAYLEPGPLRPDQQLHELRRRVEPLLGSLDGAPPGGVPKALASPTAAQVREWEDWARLVRWLRGFVSEFEEWGALAGRMRWLASRVKAASPVAKLLDPATRPTRPWAAELGQDPEAKRHKLLKRKVLQTAPGPDREADPIEVTRWVGEAIEVLPDERIAAYLAPHEGLAAALIGDAMPEGTNARRWKRRLTKIQKLALGMDPGAPPPPVEEVEDLGEVADPEAKREDPAEALLQEVLPRTRDKAALFIGNRRDPNLHEELQETFAFSRLDWCEGGPRRLQDVRDRVTSGRYDFVLGATGFQSHSMDSQMVQACRRSGIPYVRVHRGRRLACILAISRELGLGSAA